MAEKTVIDYRRTDQRTNVLHNPFWITSGLLVGSACEDKYAVCFSFPTAGELVYIEQIIFEVVAAFTAGTTIDVGVVTLATNAITTGGKGTTVDDDDFIANTDVTVATPAMYAPTASDWVTAKAAAAKAAPYVLTGAATTVPTISVLMANAGTIAAGTGRVHVLITKSPM
ncbi:MAG: hypothetical protein WC907_02935 [Acholeplasmataceae bacterium]